MHPKTGAVLKSVLKTTDKPFVAKTVDTDKGTINEVTIEPATPEEIADTVAVMGGEDWKFWVEALEPPACWRRDSRPSRIPTSGRS